MAETAAESGLAAMFANRGFAEAGGLMSYGPNDHDLFRRSATYLDKILKGARPADLPVEQPTVFDFVVNLKTAQRLGLTIPNLANALATDTCCVGGKPSMEAPRPEEACSVVGQ